MNTARTFQTAKPPLCLLEGPPPAQLDKLLRPEEADNRSHHGRFLRCAACGHVVSDESQRMDVGGSHEHTRTNPSGITFHIGCFRAAPGCRAVGQSTFEHTWFNGFAWEVSVCAACGQHLGWRFRGTSEGFHGLILARLVADSRH